MQIIQAIAVGLLSFVLFWALSLRFRARIAQTILTATAILLGAWGLLIALSTVMPFPYIPWFIEFRTWPGAELCSGLIGARIGTTFATARLHPSRHRKPELVLFVLLGFIILAIPFTRSYVCGLDYSELWDQWEGGICLQTSECTCVPACSVTIIKLLGGNLTEREIAQDAKTDKAGTDICYLKRALRKHGYESEFLILKSVKDAPVPSIICVEVQKIPHVIVLLEKDTKGVVIGDPLDGLKRRYTWVKLESKYHPDNTCIVINPRQ